MAVRGGRKRAPHNIRAAARDYPGMDAQPGLAWSMAERDRTISEAFARRRGRLRAFIRRRVPDVDEAEDILQEVFYDLVASARLAQPIEQLGAWLYRVARNRIADFFRRSRPHRLDSLDAGEDLDAAGEEGLSARDLLPAEDDGPDGALARRVLVEQIAAALEELAEEQRSVFIAHELEGQSFKEIARATGVGVNTLLARKHYAVLHLRRRLQSIHDEFVDHGGKETS